MSDMVNSCLRVVTKTGADPQWCIHLFGKSITRLGTVTTLEVRIVNSDYSTVLITVTQEHITINKIIEDEPPCLCLENGDHMSPSNQIPDHNKF
jgi:hypothetical protein